MELSADKKKEVEQMLVETIITSLEERELTAEEYPKVSSFIIENMKTVTTQEGLTQFLRELSAKWRIFSKILIIQTGEAKEKKDKETTQDVVGLAESGRIEDAIALAKKATGGLQ